VAVDEKLRPRQPQPPPRDVPKPRPLDAPDVAAVVAHDGDETAAEVPNGGADGRPHGKPSASDAAVAAAAATRMLPDDKQPPFPASCRRPPLLRRLLLLLLLPKPAVAPENRHPFLPGSRQVGCRPGTLLAAPIIQTMTDNGGHSPFSERPVRLSLKKCDEFVTTIALRLSSIEMIDDVS